MEQARLKRLEIGVVLITLFSVFIFIYHKDIQDAMSFSISETGFLVLHTLIELFSVVVAFAIFIQSWLNYTRNRLRYHFFIGLIFFAVGCIDLAHTFLYKGMPFLNDEFAIARATWLWICARLVESIGLGIGFAFMGIHSRSHRARSRLTLVGIVAVLTAFVIGFIVIFPEKLPLLVEPGVGVTKLKFSLEYFISFIHLITVFIIFSKYTKERNGEMLLLVMAVILILFSELVFTLYKNVFDFENLLGHVYKLTGYYFLYRSIFYPQLKKYLLSRKR